MISYLIVNMPEHELEFVFKDKADLERFKEIANERIKRAGGEIKEEATLNELSSTKKDDDRIPK